MKIVFSFVFFENYFAFFSSPIHFQPDHVKVTRNDQDQWDYTMGPPPPGFFFTILPIFYNLLVHFRHDFRN